MISQSSSQLSTLNSESSDADTSFVDWQNNVETGGVNVDSLEYYVNDTSNLKAADKNRYSLCACHGVVPDFDLKSKPYDTLKKGQLPTQAMYKKEILRRDPSAKLRKRKNDELLIMLHDIGPKVTSNNFTFIIESESTICSIFMDKEKEREAIEKNSNGPNITNQDRLCFIEVILSDRVKGLYSMSQDCLTRSELDNRNPVVRVCDFYDKATEVFNDEKYVPYTQSLPNLHEDFVEPIPLPLKSFRLTRDEAKDILVSIRPKLAGMIANYELSWAGVGQLGEDKDEYGHVDLDKCVDGDNWRNFIRDSKESYLLYWWHRLDDEGFIQFTICVLEKFNRANTEDFTLVLIKGMNLTPVRRSRISSKRKLARIWEGLATA